MSKIHKLPEHIISQIAAGEVIERPAYAIKELIDNAIDANADVIKIEVEESGLKKITVIDNGEGMSHDDVLESLKPHTTSKLKADTLLGIQTLGFRGEALASIGAVSTLTIQSKNLEDIAGHKVVVKNGEVIKAVPIGMPTGTIVIIENLFSNVPARRKFLKSQKTELHHIIDIVTNFAITYLNIHFSLSHNGKTIFDLPKSPNDSVRLQLLLGKELFEQTVRLSYDESSLKMTGYITNPHSTSTQPNKQYFFVNNRGVTDKAASAAVREAYGTLLSPETYPIFVLSLTVPFEMVDVNVHPRKEQIAFFNEQFVLDAIQKAVSQTLLENNLTFSNISWKKDEVKHITKSLAGKLLKEKITNSIAPKRKKSAEISQLHNLYVVTESDQGILLIDQHAAHERILLEQLLKEFAKQKKKQISLKTPIELELPLSQQEILRSFRKEFEKVGFVIKKETDGYYMTKIPDILKDRDIKKLLIELLDEIEETGAIKSVDRLSYEMLSFLACRTAIKRGDSITKQQQKKLLEELDKSPNSATCAHGRPTTILLTSQELYRLFGRT